MMNNIIILTELHFLIMIILIFFVVIVSIIAIAIQSKILRSEKLDEESDKTEQKN